MARSFDLFDTLVTRAAGNPHDVHRIVGERLAIAQYVAIRVAAERTAHERHGWRATLQDIFAAADLPPETAQQAMQLELLVEKELACPVRVGVQEFGHGDVITSDMYLPRSVLRDILAKTHPHVEPAELFISSELGRSKLHGDIWDSVRAKCPHVHEHIGDHAIADLRSPTRAGLLATRVTATELNHDERLLAAQGLSGSLCAGAAKAVRVGWDGSIDHLATVEAFASTFAPLMVTFSEWLLEEAARRGIRTVYFLARDGQLPWKICRTLAAARRHGLECRYLFVSRAALNLAGAASVEAAVEWITENPNDMSVDEAATRGELQVEAVSAALRKAGLAVDAAQRLGLDEVAVLRRVLSAEPMASAIRESIARARESAAKYLGQEGLARHNPVGIVDIGWRGNIQRALRSLLESSDSPANLVGFYLHLDNRQGRLQPDEFRSFLTDHQAGVGLQVTGYRQVLEAAFAGDHPRTVRYAMENGVAIPIFGTPSSEADGRRVAVQHRAVELFLDRLLASESITGQPLNVPRGAAIMNLSRFLCSPTPRQASCFVDCPFDGGGSDGSGVRPLCSRQSVWSLLSSRPCEGFWQEGTYAISGWGWLLGLRRWIGTAYRRLSRYLG